MARYVDGFVIPLPKKKLAAYRRVAQKAAKIWREHGALEYFETVGEELKPRWGFPKLAKLRRGETIVFSWIVYKSKADRNRVNASVMKDPRMKPMMEPAAMPFDMKRMAMGGFEVIVEA